MTATVTIEDHIAVITIDRPEAANAIDRVTWEAIGDGLASADADSDVRVVILTGSGDRVFCAGADLKALQRGNLFPEAERFQEWGFAGFVNQVVSVPTIAAVNGVALGGGTELTLACDIAVAAEHARFGLPEVKRGIIASAGGAFRLPQQIPSKLAMELLLTGRAFSAERAHELGLINAVVPSGQALEAAMDIAREIARAAPLSVRATKRLATGTQAGARPGEEERWRLARAERDRILASADAAEGVAAFAEKREPQWQAR